MDPEAVVWGLARMLVDGQSALAAMRRTADAAEHIASEAPVEARQFIDGFERFQTRWHTETLPTLAASFKLALEVFETFGPGRTCIEDPTDAGS